MPQMKEERQNPPPASRGNTETAQGETQSPKAREPFERDESADSQGSDSSEIRRMGEIAHASAERGEKDTTRGNELDATYHELRKGADPAPVDERNKTRRPG